MEDDIDIDEPAAPRSEGINLSNLAYGAISEMIGRRRLHGGEIIVESRLAETLGISRTPLREALQRLEGEGLVIKGTGRSYIVRHVDLGEYLQSLKVREILEPEAAMLATGHIPRAEIAVVRTEVDQLRTTVPYHTDAHWRSDDNVHSLFARNCGNDVLANMIKGLRVTTRLFEIARLKDRLSSDSNEHLAILKAFEREDARAARKAVQTHIASLAKFALSNLR